ncbi:MAG: tripartite tricarboxylate transporter TctB family protein [Gammaproteobacteria bacterium]|nr:tripartite tricarboxylate transporter TctB family protein [Gammaproteobacteria bacterium]
MTLDRAIAGIFLLICLIYGYTAFVTMQANLLPFELNMTFLPNTMPKWLSVLGAIVAMVVIIQSGPKADAEVDASEIDYRNLRQYKLGQALLLIGLMVAYALLLHPIGFLLATTLFLAGGGILLGERKYKLLLPVSISTALLIWYLVQEVLGIFLRPWPWFI